MICQHVPFRHGHPNSDIEDKHIRQHKGEQKSRPTGHTSYTYYKKYGKYYDWSAQEELQPETAARVAGGAVVRSFDAMGIDVIAYTVESL